MKGLKMEHKRADPSSGRDMQEIDALKTLEDPAHSRSRCGFVDLIREGLLSCHKPSAQTMLSETIDQQTQHHDEAQGCHPLRLLDKD